MLNIMRATFLSILFFLSCHLQANEYQTQFSIQYGKLDASSNESEFYSLSASHYLNPIKLGDHPYNLATFYSRQQNVKISASAWKSESKDFYTENITSASVAYSYSAKNNPFKWGIGTSISDYESEFFSTTSKSDTKSIFTNAGYYFTPSSLVNIAYQYSETDASSVDTTSEAAILSAQHVVKNIGGSALAFYASINRSRTKREAGVFYNPFSYSLTSEYYLSRKTNIFARIGWTAGSLNESGFYYLGASHFLSKNKVITTTYSAPFDDRGSNVWILEIKGESRF